MIDKNSEIIIIGGGPAGLACAYELVKNNIKCKIIESSNSLGGIAKTIKFKEYFFDLGGHRFFSKNEEINVLWKSLLGDNLLTVPRLSRIYYNGKFFFYPIKISNALYNLGFRESLKILWSYIYYKIKPIYPEISFEDWVINRFGKRLYEIFFKTYTEKIWGIDCRKISKEWAAQRIKGLSLLEVVKNNIFKISRSKKIRTLITEFYYPTYGPGMMWNAMKDYIVKNGGQILFNREVKKIIPKNEVYHLVAFNNLTQKNEVFTAKYIVSSMALNEFIRSLQVPIEEKIKNILEKLRFRSFIAVSLVVKKENLFPDQWIYIHSPEVKVGRIQNVKNWSKFMVPGNVTLLVAEYFCSEGDELWSCSDDEILELASEEILKLKFANSKEEIEKGIVVRVKNAYPVYYLGFEKDLLQIKEFISRLRNIQIIGRGGLYRYNNMDHSMLSGIYAARNLLGKNYDVWLINVEKEYLEEK